MDGIPPLAVTPEERRGVWAWALTAELARSESTVEPLRRELWESGRSDLSAWWWEQGHAGRFEEYWAVLTGLRLAMALRVTSLSESEAQALLVRVAELPPERW